MLLPDGHVLPDVQLEKHPWLGSDILTYVKPAVSFCEMGTFMSNGQADLHRTIGYPLFLAIMMKLFDGAWIPFSYLVQLLIFALLFPVHPTEAYFLPIHSMTGIEAAIEILFLDFEIDTNVFSLPSL